jgi:NAD dependent epimerase/dehydratase
MNIKNLNVAVTGAEGFIGSHLTEYLLESGANVRALVQYNSISSWGWIEHLQDENNLDVRLGDVRDARFCNDFLESIDIVFHLAALIAIPYSYSASQSYIDTNIHGTHNICQSAILNKCKRVIHTSTSEVYGTALYVPIDESHPMQAQSPYSASKIGADAIATSFNNSFDMPLTIVRPFNTYGPRQSARAIIPTVITQLASGNKVLNLGDTSPTRDFNYVKDTARGFVELAMCDQAVGKTVNLGSNAEISMFDLIQLIGDIFECEITIKTDISRIRPKDSEVFRLWADNTLAKKLIGYHPEFSIRDGLQETIDWFTKAENLMRYKSGSYNV